MQVFWILIPSLLYLFVVFPYYLQRFMQINDLIEPFIILFKMFIWWIIMEAMGPFSMFLLIYFATDADFSAGILRNIRK